MLLDNTNNYLSSLISAGPDAMSNLYYVKFTGTGSGGAIDDATSTALTIRTSNIQGLPAPSHKTNTINFMTTSVDVPAASFDLDKKLTITFRLDSNYALYEFLLERQKSTSIGNLAYAATKIPEESELPGMKIAVYGLIKAVDSKSLETPSEDGFSNSNYTKLYEFRHCWISDISTDQYSYGSSNPMTVKASFYYFDYDDPQSLLV
jgi:hypothetical protein